MTEQYKTAGVEPPSFPILSDAGNHVAKQYGLTFTMDETAHGWFKSLGGDLPAFNGDYSWTLPIPATYLVLPMERRISFAMVDVDYTKRVDPSVILKALRAASKPIGMGSNEEEDRAERRARRRARKQKKEQEEQQIHQ